MGVNGVYDMSKLSVEKSLIEFGIMNERFEKLHQWDKWIFRLCDEGIDIGDIVRDEDV
jgi:hypothetical protein